MSVALPTGDTGDTGNTLDWSGAGKLGRDLSLPADESDECGAAQRRHRQSAARGWVAVFHALARAHLFRGDVANGQDGRDEDLDRQEAATVQTAKPPNTTGAQMRPSATWSGCGTRR
jgi:hypothetical protein